MDPATIYAIVIAILTILGVPSVWKYVGFKAKMKHDQENYVKYDCRERITKLEALLEKSAKEKEEMRGTILELTAMVSELKVKIEFMEMENAKLKSPDVSDQLEDESEKDDK